MKVKLDEYLQMEFHRFERAIDFKVQSLNLQALEFTCLRSHLSVNFEY